MPLQFPSVKQSALLLCLTCSIFFCSCGKERKNNSAENTEIIPEFYSNLTKNPPVFVEIGNASSKISNPQDLDFNPTRENELWVINKGTENSGGSTVMFTKTGTTSQKYDYRQDLNAWHFMSLPSAISFSSTGNWATTANVLDANHSGGTYTGPTLWSGDLNIYAKYAGPGTNGSHLDMLHGSPYSMGIESEFSNVYWLLDGYNEEIVRYDFVGDHGPGNHNHDDGKIHRYSSLKVKRDPSVPSHLVFDSNKEWLYIVDGGNKRILRLNVLTGEKIRELSQINEVLSEHWEIGKFSWDVVVPSEVGLKQPCGIEIKDNRLFVSDYETGEIICFNIDTKKEIGRIKTPAAGIMGIKIGADGKLWYVNAANSQVYRIDPQ
ncbi:MAG: hypothetical protein KG003_00650 [Bacteroidetes bacterium]|nr:hypothetical protein [Bacteroidota bacterium]